MILQDQIASHHSKSCLELQIKRPIIAADTIRYWAIARELNLTLKPVMDSLSKLVKIY